MDEVVSKFPDEAFTLREEERIQFNRGVEKAAVWIKLHLLCETDEQGKDFYLEVDFPSLDLVQLYSPEKDEQFRVAEGGDTLPFSVRPLPVRPIVFPNALRPGAPVYLRIQTDGTMLLPLRFLNERKFWQERHLDGILLGAYAGVIAGLLLYNVFLWGSIGQKSYLYYVLFIGSLALQQIEYVGAAHQYLWPDSPWWNTRAYVFLAAFAGLWALSFTRSFLDLRNHFPLMNRVLWGLSGWFVLMCVLTLIFGPAKVQPWLTPSLPPIVAIALITAAVTLRRGIRQARYFLVANGITGLSIITISFFAYALVPNSSLVRYSVVFATMLDAILLSFALADRVNILREQREDAMGQQLRLSANIDLLLNATRDFAACADGQRAMETACSYLEKWHPDLRDSSCTIMIGPGVSSTRGSEFYRRDGSAATPDRSMVPIDGDAIPGILESTETSFDQGIFVLKGGGQINGKLYWPALPEQIGNESHEFLEGLLQSLTLALDAIENANQRGVRTVGQFASEVFHDMQNDLRSVGFLSEAMENPFVSKEQKHQLLKLIQSGMKELLEKADDVLQFALGDRGLQVKGISVEALMAEIQTDLDLFASAHGCGLRVEVSATTLIQIDARRLRRAVANIAYNAFRAMSGKGTLTIRSRFTASMFIVEIEDTGPGFSRETQSQVMIGSRVTKPDGHGLGLAIARRIVEAHKGHLSFASIHGAGTRFVLELPRN